MEGGTHHTRGSAVWVQDPVRGWVKGDVLRVEPDRLTVQTGNGDTIVCKPEDCPLQNPHSQGGVEVS